MYYTLTSIAAAYAGAKARQVKRDILVMAFIAMMGFLTALSLLGAFAAFVAQTEGPVIGLLAAAGLTVVLALVALAIRAVLRRRALRRQRIATSSAASALAVSTASNVIAQNKGMALAAGLAVGVLAGVLVRSGRD
ncbi:hypothetical protein [Hoeflea olei]|uniref:Uncharacterized protein n=1 Tax=Hoeflea olei TaxID=1480615 RepID=A0A1C1YU83_9HYPH|nr:hypothetical protein [Hoeflea olei]OCW56936.1 hypothetical protein AWJ14_07195 [Hoeflea olei]